jgi:hypothetical protein
MKLVHDGSEITELPEEWLAEAGMSSFVPKAESYRVDASSCEGRRVLNVRIEEVAPVSRSKGVPIFNDDIETGRTARERVVCILRGFHADTNLPPVGVTTLKPGSAHKYKLVAGVHRFYCSLAVGFTSVPAVEGFDWGTLDT